MDGIIAGLLQDIRNELRRESTMKIEESQKNVRILVKPTDWLSNDIHCNGKIFIDRICGDYEASEYKGQVGKIIAIEPLNDKFCAVMLAVEESEAVKIAKSNETQSGILTRTIQIDKPDSIYSNEQIIKCVKGELEGKNRNDTAAKDYFARLANRIEYYGLTDKDFANTHPYWRSYVAYIRHGDYPNPGIDRNTHEFAYTLNRAIETLQDVKE